MAIKNSLAAEVQQRAKALEDWAISVLGNTTQRSSEADQALRHHGTKGIRGRPFTFFVGDVKSTTALVVHGHIETIACSVHDSTRTIGIAFVNPIYHNGNSLSRNVITMIQDAESHCSTGWMLASDDSNIDAERTNDDDELVVTLTIE